MELLTNKQVLDKAVSGVMKQGRLSSHSGSCYYRHPDVYGVKCGIGHLIEDRFYDINMECQSVGSAYSKNPESEELLLTAGLAGSGIDLARDGMRQMLNDIQEVHDGVSNLEVYALRMRELYDKHGVCHHKSIEE